jgi:RNA polymerase sigma-70 factor (ECF subfamily)
MGIAPAPLRTAGPNTAELPLTAETVFHQYAPRVFTLACRLLGNPIDADDVTQDVFLQVVRKLPTFRGESAFSTWLYRITVNTALAFRRKRARRESHRTFSPLDAFADDGSHRAPVRRWLIKPEQPVFDQEAHQVIDQAISKLPEKYRDVFVLADVEEIPLAEIATMIGLHLPAVKSRLHRARQLMQHLLAPYFEDNAA